MDGCRKRRLGYRCRALKIAAHKYPSLFGDDRQWVAGPAEHRVSTGSATRHFQFKSGPINYQSVAGEAGFTKQNVIGIYNVSFEKVFVW
jgi:hypothetical protein